MIEYVRQVAAEAVGAREADVRVSIRPALAYQSNRLYNAFAGEQHLIVKEYLKPEEFEEAPVREFEALQLVAPLDLAPPLLFCRADARFANVIARLDGRLGLVDWEDSGLRDPALDLADLVTAPNQEDLLAWEGWQPFLQAYLEGHISSDPGLARRMHLYLALFPLAWLAWLLSAGADRTAAGDLEGWLIHEMAPNKRLRRYLARAAAWPDLDFCGNLEAVADVQFFPEPGGNARQQ